MIIKPSDPRKHHQAGFSLVELMVAVTIGLLLMAGLTGVFVNSSKSRAEVEKANRQIENGRYAVQLMTDDLRLAGFYGEFDPTVLTAPSTVQNPCLTAISDLTAALPLHVQGYDNGIDSTVTCLSDVRTGTDVLVVRHTSGCVAGSTDCDPVVAGIPYFQASLCSNASELGSSNNSNFFAMDTDTASLTRRKRNCTTVADLRRYRTHIYFIANNDKSADGIPTLKRAELGADGFTIVPLVEGIENLQIEYGLDIDGNGTPEVYTADPSTYNACVGATCVSNWQSAVSVKLNLLARNTDESLGYTDSKTYTLGLKKDGTANSVGPFNDHRKRHAYEAVVRLNNPAGRREP
jgi:type IV pilus assembly protein PilW